MQQKISCEALYGGTPGTRFNPGCPSFDTPIAIGSVQRGVHSNQPTVENRVTLDDKYDTSIV